MKFYLNLCLSALLSLTVACADSENPEFEVDVDARPISDAETEPVVSYADVLGEATPSVVSVYTARIVTVSPGGAQPGVPELFRRFGIPVPPQREGGNNEEGVERRQRLGVGSGVIVSENGYILTNHHVVSDPRGGAVDEIRVRLEDRSEHVAKLVGSDEKTDVAVLKIDVEEPLPAIAIADSDNLRVGDVVFAIGNPLEVGLTATQGIVSATGRNSLGILGSGGYEDFIQTDAAINLGNSGGALIDAWGRLIGINTAIMSRSGGSNGIGFAIPANLVLNVATNLIETGEVPRGLLGLFPTNLTPDLVEAFDLEGTQGALVNQVQEGSPADRAGIRHGDIIVRVDDIPIESAPQLRLTVSQMMPGREVSVKLIRQGEELTVPVVLGSLGGEVATTESKQDILEGVMLVPVDADARRQYSIPEEVDGVRVSRVEPSSPYAGVLAENMVLIEVNGEYVASPKDVADNLKEGANRLYSWLGGTKRYIVIRVGE